MLNPPQIRFYIRPRPIQVAFALWAASSSWPCPSRLWWTASRATTRTGSGVTRWPTRRGRGRRREKRWSFWWETTCLIFWQFQVPNCIHLGWLLNV